MGQAKFSLGQVVATPGALAAMECTGQSPVEFLTRHVTGDWGEVDIEDWAENELSLREGFRLMSVYPLKDRVKLWIITEADRNVTTFLLSEEY